MRHTYITWLVGSRHRLLAQRMRGQALIMVALALVLLVAMVGLALDGANAFGQRRRVSYAADAASLAATRTLIQQQRIGGSGAPINSAIQDFLTSGHQIDASNLTWTAFYVQRDAPDVTVGTVDDSTTVPSNVDGVQVNVSFSFDTYFMRIMGMRMLSVGTSGTSIYGPLGTAVGQDLAPLGISVTGLEVIKNAGESSNFRLDLRGNIAAAAAAAIPPQPIPDDVVTEANLAHVSFREVAGAPTTGNDCGSSTVEETLTYWWCHGSPNKLRINRELPFGTPNFPLLNSAISWRSTNRPLAVLPVYATVIRFQGGSPQIFYQLVNFVAVDLRGLDSDGALRGRLVEDYATSGSMVGEGSGVETGVWAVNLKR